MLIVERTLYSSGVGIGDVDLVCVGEYQIEFMLIDVIDSKPERGGELEIEASHDSAPVNSIGRFAVYFLTLLIEVADRIPAYVVKK